MARPVRPADEWPDELREYDPERWSSEAAWHLARAAAAPTRRDWLNEIRASVGCRRWPVWPGGLAPAVRAIRRPRAGS